MGTSTSWRTKGKLEPLADAVPPARDGRDRVLVPEVGLAGLDGGNDRLGAFPAELDDADVVGVGVRVEAGVGADAAGREAGAAPAGSQRVRPDEHVDLGRGEVDEAVRRSEDGVGGDERAAAELGLVAVADATLEQRDLEGVLALAGGLPADDLGVVARGRSRRGLTRGRGGGEEQSEDEQGREQEAGAAGHRGDHAREFDRSPTVDRDQTVRYTPRPMLRPTSLTARTWTRCRPVGRLRSTASVRLPGTDSDRPRPGRSMR